MMGPRGENAAIEKAAERAGIDDDKAGHNIGLPAAVAYVAAASATPQKDQMYNFLDTGAEYYLNLLLMRVHRYPSEYIIINN
ncbi:unnamed protein product [Arctia plantaginis]|uniref:Uncharacterized protein n=1 Tax=Arctia plantaginis TaxID=874455 RepID=A0A8S0ZKF5_ARCPL|nr:unnamed protein product [Arctia plantaginis]